MNHVTVIQVVHLSVCLTATRHAVKHIPSEKFATNYGPTAKSFWSFPFLHSAVDSSLIQLTAGGCLHNYISCCLTVPNSDFAQK